LHVVFRVQVFYRVVFLAITIVFLVDDMYCNLLAHRKGFVLYTAVIDQQMVIDDPLYQE